MEIGDAAAVALARTGDRDAFRLLVERHSRRVFRLAYRLTGSEADAEDIVQETFLRAYRSLDRLQEQALVGRWLYRIASNCALDSLRQKKAEPDRAGLPGQASGGPDLAAEAGEPGPERRLMAGQLQAQIGAALDALSAQERVAFTLRHFEGRSIEEIGEVLGTAASATKQAVFRAVQKMRRALQPSTEGAGEPAAGGRAGLPGGAIR
jgi:RNA polymerase sigma-70 factor (ECF subfamily)